ncbi:MAG: MTAP family purine nucleoside phosphorylase, partial [Candidatus Bathyarchaeia archaeon]
MKKAKVAIIGGSGTEKLFPNLKPQTVKTPYGMAKPIFVGKVEGGNLVFLPRHGANHSLPPHKINYRANIYALHKLGAKTVLATNAVGAINERIMPGDVVVPHDFVDFTKLRVSTFYDKAPVTHVDVSQPYCPDVRKLLIE